ncbi:MAG: PilZ domain-containing protein [Polyangiales bacterium]
MGVLLVSATASAEVERVRAVCRALGLADLVAVDEGAALAHLRSRRDVVIVDASHGQARAMVAAIRRDRALCDLPVFALTHDAQLASLSRVLNWGVDDALAPAPRASLEALLTLSTQSAPGDAAAVATVAFAREDQRLLRAGVLRAQGHRSLFCASYDELRWCVDDPTPQFFVVGADLLRGPAGLAAVRALDVARRPWVLVAPESEVDAWQSVCDDGTVVVSDAAPISDAALRALQVKASAARDVRTTPRLHHVSVVHYTTDAGTTPGLSFNVARDGLYVRAAAPPPRGASLQLELTPPGSHATVRLEGVVAWSKPFGGRAFASSPPGFGVAIAGGDEAQVLRWHRGYERLRVARTSGVRARAA